MVRVEIENKLSKIIENEKIFYISIDFHNGDFYNEAMEVLHG